MERVARIELASSAWKAEVLPLYHTRDTLKKRVVEGDGFEPSKLARQIYSLLPLATREPLLNGRKVCRKALLLSTVFVNFISYYKHLEVRYHFASLLELRRGAHIRVTEKKLQA